MVDTINIHIGAQLIVHKCNEVRCTVIAMNYSFAHNVWLQRNGRERTGRVFVEMISGDDGHETQLDCCRCVFATLC